MFESYVGRMNVNNILRHQQPRLKVGAKHSTKTLVCQRKSFGSLYGTKIKINTYHEKDLFLGFVLIVQRTE